MIPLTRDLGAFIRWILKGCKTRLKDESEGILNPTWGGSYDFENYVIGLISAGLISGLIIFLFF